MPATRLKWQLMSASEIDRTLVRLVHEVVEKNEGLDRLADKIEQLESSSLPVEAWTLLSTATTVP